MRALRTEQALTVDVDVANRLTQTLCERVLTSLTVAVTKKILALWPTRVDAQRRSINKRRE